MRKAAHTAIAIVSSAVVLSGLSSFSTFGANVFKHSQSAAVSRVHTSGDIAPLPLPAGRPAGSADAIASLDHSAQPQRAKVDTAAQAHYAYSPYPSNLSLVKVKAYGSDVTTADVNHVTSILKEVGSVGRVSSFLGLRMSTPATIYLVRSSSSYAKLLKSIGVSKGDAQSLSEDSNGFTLGNTIIIPLNQNPSDADLANTLTHELTHATINQNISSIPSWMNEGMAVYMGFNAQKSLEPLVQFEGDEREYAEDILQVVQSNQLVPLTGDESAILAGTETYDYELQDWLAMCNLIHQFGISSIARLANALTHENADQAFQSTFGESVAAFNTQFTKQLEVAAKEPNSGALVTINVASHVSGSIQFLGPDQSHYQAVALQSGTHQIKWNKNGSLVSSLAGAAAEKPTDSPDPTSAYISVVPTTKLTVGKKQVHDFGFRFDFENGLYAFQSGWIDFTNGQVTDVTQPSALGFTITNVTELDTSNPIISMLNAE
ncbi:hypothetical protein [Alicyclobacillus acidiphilus]|uniref:hypothetical protein n=1 Tax=Alicyclobacillus acidiphilus TaxID=182455 RepID=UPI000835406E|nr:hypothetical protein [Alicyclobacillus acidiphilus]